MAARRVGVAPSMSDGDRGPSAARPLCEMHAGRELPDHTYEITTNARRFDYSSRAFGDAYALSAGLAYLEHVGVGRIEEHTINNLARKLQEGLDKQGHPLFTPPGNRSAIVTFYTSKPSGEVPARFTRPTSSDGP